MTEQLPVQPGFIICWASWPKGYADTSMSGCSGANRSLTCKVLQEVIVKLDMKNQVSDLVIQEHKEEAVKAQDTSLLGALDAQA